MKIVTSYPQLDTNHKIYCAVWLQDQLWHPLMNSIVAVGIRSAGETYIFPVQHRDIAESVSMDMLRNMLAGHSVVSNDAKLIHLLFGESTPLSVTQSTTVHPKWIPENVHLYVRHIDNIKNAYRFVPFAVIADWLDATLKRMEPEEREDRFMQMEYPRCLAELERAGIKVNMEKLEQHFPTVAKRYATPEGYIYSSYNQFTTTGRASNALGVNFSALNKTDGSREIIVSRFDGGHLISVDFEAYHLRLIADALNVILPTDSIHTELAKIYFSTDTVTPEQYELSKQKTFEIIYGMTSEAPDIGLFNAIKQKRNDLWVSYSRYNTILLPDGILTSVKDATPSKVFNYYVQALEVVKTIPKLQTILTQLKSMQSKLVLYTYDGMLFDVHPDEDLSEFWPILEEYKKFPIRRYKGSDYNTLTELI